jgi:hypothetical protein
MREERKKGADPGHSAHLGPRSFHTCAQACALMSEGRKKGALRTEERLRTNEGGQVDGRDHAEGAEFVELPREPAIELI